MQKRVAHKRLHYDHGRVDGDLANLVKSEWTKSFREVRYPCITAPCGSKPYVMAESDIKTLTLNQMLSGLDIIER